MTPEFVFNIANPLALLGWIGLALCVFLKKRSWIALWPGWIWPLGLACVYSALILFFFQSAEGGFDTLANVQLLFTSRWVALAGWIHYLAFDLFIGAWITGQVFDRGLPRLGLAVILPLTFLFGPVGLLSFWIYSLAFNTRTLQS